MSEQWGEWIEWKGGVCPVPETGIVEVQFRMGSKGVGTGKFYTWNHSGELADIIAYRRFTPQEAPAPAPVQMPVMDLRDWFAGQALAGICASGPSKDWTNEMLAKESYPMADTMLKQREVKS